MEFKEQIQNYEQSNKDLTYICKTGKIPVVLTAVHTMKQIKSNGDYKMSEPYTKALALYITDAVDCFCLVKNKDTGIDSNNSDDDDFKRMLLDIIKDQNIKLVIDLHGAKKERDFYVELGTLNNLSSDFSTLKELIEAFNENGVPTVAVNDPFKGGAVTKKVFSETECDVVQIEINGNFRDIEDSEKIEKISNSLIAFIRQYNEIINR